MDMVKSDLLQRKEKITRMSDQQLQNKLEKMLREEEEWESMVMYRRDTRFADAKGEYNHKLQLDRTILDMLHAPRIETFACFKVPFRTFFSYTKKTHE